MKTCTQLHAFSGISIIVISQCYSFSTSSWKYFASKSHLFWVFGSCQWGRLKAWICKLDRYLSAQLKQAHNTAGLGLLTEDEFPTHLSFAHATFTLHWVLSTGMSGSV